MLRDEVQEQIRNDFVNFFIRQMNEDVIKDALIKKEDKKMPDYGYEKYKN